MRFSMEKLHGFLFKNALILIILIAINECSTDTDETCLKEIIAAQNCPDVQLEDFSENSGFVMPSENDISKVGNVLGIIPIHYDWTTDFINSSHFEGKTKILIKSVQETKRIALNAFELEFNPKKVSLHQCGSAKNNCLSKFIFSKKAQFVILDFNEPLSANHKYILSFDQYIGTTGKHDASDEKTSAGIWRNNFTSSSWAVATIFQMRNARKAFPCFDHPSLKATFDICIKHTTDTVALSNTEVATEEKLGEDRIKHCFKRTPKMPTYVTTVSLTANFTKLEDKAKNPQVEIFFSNEENERKFNWQIAEARRIFEFCETELNLKYNLTRFGVLNLTPLKFWGIENFGLITIESGTPRNMNNREETIHRILVHEIIHQWLGNVATVSSWDEICLQEGLTAYLEWIITDKLKLVNTSFDKTVKDTLKDTWDMSKGFENERTRITNKLIANFNRTQDIANYCFRRSPIILNMIAYSYGNDVWLKFIGKLVERYPYKNANFEDWINLLSDVAGKPEAGEVLRSWYTEKGYPLIYASAESSTKINLQQKIVEGYNDPLEPTKGFTIPLKIGSDASLSNIILFNQPKQSIDINGPINKWFLVDPDFITFTRKVYSASNYLALIECKYGSDKSSCKLTSHQFEETFSYMCYALRNNILPWSFGNENDTNVDQWKNLFTKLRDLIVANDPSYLFSCRCGFLLKEDFIGSFDQCVYLWNGIWRSKKLMKMIGRTYMIDRGNK